MDKIIPIGNEINKLLKDQQYLDKIMIDGNNKATIEADSVLKKVYEIVGFIKA